MKFGIFYELQLPKPWRSRRRVRADTARPRPDRAGRRPRLRLRVGGRAPLPRGVQPLVGARGVPGGGEPAHQADPARPRHRPAHDQPPGRAWPSGSARSTSSARAGSSWASARASSVTELHPFDRRFRDKRAIWEDAVRCVLPMFWEEGWEYHGELLRLPVAQRHAEAPPEAAPAAVGRVQPARDDRDGRPPRHGRPRVPVRVGRGRRGVGARLLQLVHEAARPAVRLPDQPEHRRRRRSSCVPPTDEEAQAMADGSTFFQFALRFYNTHGTGRARHGRACGTSTRSGRRTPTGQSGARAAV